MIKFEHTEVYGWEAAIRGMRNPMNSWDKSDSKFSIENNVREGRFKQSVEIGENDLKLMKSLSKAGSDHGKFLRFINVTVDIDAPLYFWKEFKTYRNGRKFLDCEPDAIPYEYLEFDIEMNSCSTMHKIAARELTLDDFSFEDCDEWVRENICKIVVNILNSNIRRFNAVGNKEAWRQVIQLLPSSFNQKRTVLLNYQVLKAMYFARKNHKLKEWHEFCDWCETLPYFKEICIDV